MSGTHSNYIVYVDESGDHGMESINRDFPLFALSFCIFEKKTYIYKVAPDVRELKFRFFGHDMIVFHERDIRKKEGPFSMMSKDPRELFMAEFSQVMEDSPFHVIAVVIDKKKLQQISPSPLHPYHLAVEYGLERIFHLLKGKNQAHYLTHVVFEARGKVEDKELELEFRRICDGDNSLKENLPFEIILADKKTNSEGLQLADLTARPIALSVLRPGQTNRAFEIIEKKIYCDGSGKKEEVGLKVFP